MSPITPATPPLRPSLSPGLRPMISTLQPGMAITHPFQRRYAVRSREASAFSAAQPPLYTTGHGFQGTSSLSFSPNLPPIGWMGALYQYAEKPQPPNSPPQPGGDEKNTLSQLKRMGIVPQEAQRLSELLARQQDDRIAFGCKLWTGDYVVVTQQDRVFKGNKKHLKEQPVSQASRTKCLEQARNLQTTNGLTIQLKIGANQTTGKVTQAFKHLRLPLPLRKTYDFNS